MRINLCTLAMCLATSLHLTACGTEEPGSSTEEEGNVIEREETDYYPMVVGDSWTYEERDVYNNVQKLIYEVVDKEIIEFGYETGERAVFVIENTLPDKGEESRTQYIEDDGVRAVRHRHLIYDKKGILTKKRNFVPGFLRFDRGRVRKGDSWTEEVTKYSDALDGLGVQSVKTKYQYEVAAVDEQVTVDAGTFRCIRIRRQEVPGNEVKEYYFGRGVGKVKEVTEGVKTETLKRYRLAPRP